MGYQQLKLVHSQLQANYPEFHLSSSFLMSSNQVIQEEIPFYRQLYDNHPGRQYFMSRLFGCLEQLDSRDSNRHKQTSHYGNQGDSWNVDELHACQQVLVQDDIEDWDD